MRFLPGAEELLDDVDELDELDGVLDELELLGVLELLLEELELLPHAARARASATTLSAASPNHRILAFTGIPFAGGKTQR